MARKLKKLPEGKELVRLFSTHYYTERNETRGDNPYNGKARTVDGRVFLYVKHSEQLALASMRRIRVFEDPELETKLPQALTNLRSKMMQDLGYIPNEVTSILPIRTESKSEIKQAQIEVAKRQFNCKICRDYGCSKCNGIDPLA